MLVNHLSKLQRVIPNEIEEDTETRNIACHLVSSMFNALNDIERHEVFVTSKGTHACHGQLIPGLKKLCRIIHSIGKAWSPNLSALAFRCFSVFGQAASRLVPFPTVNNAVVVHGIDIDVGNIIEPKYNVHSRKAEYLAMAGIRGMDEKATAFTEYRFQLDGARRARVACRRMLKHCDDGTAMSAMESDFETKSMGIDALFSNIVDVISLERKSRTEEQNVAVDKHETEFESMQGLVRGHLQAGKMDASASKTFSSFHDAMVKLQETVKAASELSSDPGSSNQANTVNAHVGKGSHVDH